MMKVGVILLGMVIGVGGCKQRAAVSYSNDFEGSEVGKTPGDIVVIDGSFAVREVEGNRCLELAGTPLDTFGAMFGPDQISAGEAGARVWGDVKGRRFPEFGLGMDSTAGYKLIVLAGRGLVELRDGDEVIGVGKFEWKPGSWTRLKLKVGGEIGKWPVWGKVWRDGQAEPGQWTVSAQAPRAPLAGKATIWGTAFSEEPIRFDDLSVKSVGSRR